ncbi:curli-like amyloid fiber formation chaperone CsgH [Methyloceanibacter sp.]|uniref:curli-like amyloid fiber formation chaperone CsgH n=1 Tax=Methyloceanibacter sp. TaxID=1965321 RepID=UPI002BB263B0|nr:curli-like amyloid fiber formation chaperone CsgH [Methyloceanibacter sp.]
MSNFATVILASLLPLIGAWSASALANGGAPAPLPDEFAGDLPRCEIRAETYGRGVVLEGLVFADVPITGTYQFRISQRGAGGSSQINQGGEFEAAPDEPASLGTVLIGSGPNGFRATLTVRWRGGTVDCNASTGKRRVELAPPARDTPTLDADAAS